MQFVDCEALNLTLLASASLLKTTLLGAQELLLALIAHESNILNHSTLADILDVVRESEFINCLSAVR